MQYRGIEMDYFYHTDEENKAQLLRQNHGAFDQLAAALRSGDYAIVMVTPPTHVGEPVAYNHASWDGYNNGHAQIRYGTGRDETWTTIQIAVSRFGNDVAYGETEHVKIPLGDLYGTFCPRTQGVIYLRIPERIAAIVRDLTDSGTRQYENAEETAYIRELDQRDAEMRDEAERDPEGAFGGRGNNFPI